MRADAAAEGPPPGEAQIVNLSQGGVCLRLGEQLSRDHDLLLHFTVEGQEFVVPSRVAWQRLDVPRSEDEDAPVAATWLAGFEFVGDEAATLIAVFPHDVLASCDLSVDVLPERRAHGDLTAPAQARPAESELITFSEKTVLGVKTAAQELLPVLSRHFSDVHMVFTRDRVEISAPFRHPAEAEALEGRRRNAAPRTAPAAAPAAVAPPPLLPQPAGAAASPGRRRALLGGAALALAIVVGIVVARKHEATLRADAAVAPAAAPQRIPAWATGIAPGSLSGWVGLQKHFRFSDATMRAAIGVLRANTDYSPGQSLYDLTQYPAQVQRALSLIAGAHFDFGPLETDLKGRIVSGARFPDEPPGAPYSSLEPASFHNVVVLAAISLLHRDRAEPAVKTLLAALRRSSG